MPAVPIASATSARRVRLRIFWWPTTGVCDRSGSTAGRDGCVRILVIEDDPATADYIARGLAQEGQTAEVARTGKDGLFLALSESFDVIVTDRMLPAPDGLAIVRALRASSVMTPVLVLTALGDVERRVEGLDAGADDYLAKPFAFSELYARVRALSRRPAA